MKRCATALMFFSVLVIILTALETLLNCQTLGLWEILPQEGAFGQYMTYVDFFVTTAILILIGFIGLVVALALRMLSGRLQAIEIAVAELKSMRVD